MSVVHAKEILSRVAGRSRQERGISAMARELVANEILGIAAEIRALVSEGADIKNLTIGDFKTDQFPIPELLKEGIKQALDAGHSNYPPANGILECREAVQALTRDQLGLDYPIGSFLIAGGARPMIAGAYLALLSPGDRVVYSTPSWNNNHYATLSGAVRVEVPTTRATNFFPRVEDIEPHLKTARMICLCTPQNPTGTVMDPGELTRLCTAIVAENERREAHGEAPCYLLFDQVYSTLTFGEARHHNPVSLVPAMAAYTILVDAISKSFAATGLRVGWAVGPEDVIERMGALLTHIGAWAPRPEQVATAQLLRNKKEMTAYTERMKTGVLERLELLSRGVAALAKEGFDVEAIAPAGAIYLSMRLGIRGKSFEGKRLETDEDVRRFLLREAKVALVPFTAFGLREDTGWFRASVGAVSTKDCAEVGERLAQAFRKLS